MWYCVAAVSLMLILFTTFIINIVIRQGYTPHKQIHTTHTKDYMDKAKTVQKQ